MQVAEWGNGLAARLAAAVVEAIQLTEDDEIEIQVAGAHEFAVARKASREERSTATWLPTLKFDRDEANAR